MNRIEVTCAIIMKDEKILACQRGQNSDHPFEWEFPGGKIEENETSEDCIKREIREELSIGIEIIKPLEFVDFDYPKKKIRLIPFLCEIEKGEINPTEHHAIKWLPIDSFASLKWAEADEVLFHKSVKEIR